MTPVCPDGWAFEHMGGLDVYRSPGGTILAFEPGVTTPPVRAEIIGKMSEVEKGFTERRFLYFDRNPKTGAPRASILDIGLWLSITKRTPVFAGDFEGGAA